jgi:hypothetical protein
VEQKYLAAAQAMILDQDEDQDQDQDRYNTAIYFCLQA